MHITLDHGVLTILDDDPTTIIQIRESSITEVGFDTIDGYWLYADGIRHQINKNTMNLIVRSMHTVYYREQTQ